MKLARKLTAALLLGMAAVLAVSGWSTAHREIALFEEDRARDHRIMGEAVGSALARVWEISGEKEALRLIEGMDRNKDSVKVRWQPLVAGAGTPSSEAVSPEVLSSLHRGQEAVKRQRGADGIGHHYTYVPVRLHGDIVGAIRIDESARDQEHYVRNTILRILVTTMGIVIVCGILVIALGLRWVGRPVQELIDKARRVGSGDLSRPLAVNPRDELGELAGEINLMTDHLARARDRVAEETRARIATLEQLRHADRLNTVGKLASGVAHELGTPLNVVWAQAKMIQSGEVTGEAITESAGVISEQSARMTRIIRQLLDYVRPKRPSKVPFCLQRLSREALALFEAMARKRSVALELAGAATDPSIEAQIDPDQIQQVLSNLIVNGIQAMPQGGRLTVSVSRERVRPPPDHGGPEGDYHCIRVRDEGVGIRPEDLPHLFTPFFTTKEVGEGTGLGLSVSSGIVREHGGWIGVESRVGGGSSFLVFLP